ncbi:GNAT family N-acetyltransferase [Saccharopolyspora sp. 6V]|uniref:GNAT family N-acetyltransferase n=1 Tax=Saccharopolyspora sp. 6V TaxID=2877239 RepID=UPI001CD472C8|nr:GNAT family N-acetyltransferase [Saccharopolyspora sp. 6V]MCA1195179.1 GNAT family N-acetyltransferase [Saccharopolyspora sp. 6V]
MTDVDVRPLAESEYRPSFDLFLASLHEPQRTGDERWQRPSTRYEPGRVFGAFLDGELAGTALSMTSALEVPGGAVLPAAAVTGVGVRADRTRRGLLRELMRAQLTELRERGEPLAVLHASETRIYPRFGYGLGTRSQRVQVARTHAELRPDAPIGGQVRLVDGPAAEKLLPELYSRIAAGRPGLIARGEGWWTTRLAGTVENGGALRVAVHSDDSGTDDGFALWEPSKTDHHFGDGSIRILVSDMHGADDAATASLWRFLLGLDLATSVIAVDRPLDEPLPWWLADRRGCGVDRVDDDLWVRLVDVPAALAARSYGAAEPVVVEVRDPFLPQNSGRYRIGPGGAEPVADAPQLGLDVDVLGSLYLGDVRPSTLAAANRVEVHEPSALAAADRLFAAARPPWCGTQF